MRALVLLISTFTLSAPAEAVDPCMTSAYVPQAIYRQVLGRLPELKIAAVARHLVDRAGPIAADEQQILIRNGDIVGIIQFRTDARTASSTFNVWDADGVALFSLQDRRRLCADISEAPGLCHEVMVATELQPSLGDTLPLVMTLKPDIGAYPHYHRYGHEVGFVDWRAGFADMLAWLNATLADTTTTIKPQAQTAKEKIFWSLASEPMIAPYLDRLSIDDAGVRITINGVVPSRYIYDLVLEQAFRAGYPTVGTNMTIDTRTALPLDTDPLLMCPVW